MRFLKVLHGRKGLRAALFQGGLLAEVVVVQLLRSLLPRWAVHLQCLHTAHSISRDARYLQAQHGLRQQSPRRPADAPPAAALGCPPAAPAQHAQREQLDVQSVTRTEFRIDR